MGSKRGGAEMELGGSEGGRGGGGLGVVRGQLGPQRGERGARRHNAGLATRVHEVEQHAAPLNVPQKRVPKPHVVGRAQREPRNVGDGESRVVGELDHSEVRVERGEGVGGHLEWRGRAGYNELNT